MGWFDSDYETYVSSSIYNMAGDYVDRTNYMKYLVATGVMSDTDMTLGEVINKGLITGPGIKYKSFYRFVQRNHPMFIPNGMATGETSLSAAEVAPHIAAPTGKTVNVIRAEYGYGDYKQWAEKFIITNYPERLKTNWRAQISPSSIITITWADLTTVSITPSPGYSRTAKYVYVDYSLLDGAGNEGEVISYIYRVGTGNTGLDALVKGETIYSGWFPVLPVRQYNKMIDSSPYNTSIYPDTKKIFRRLSSGGKLDDLIAQIKTNDSLPDIDFCHMIFGVPLNTKTKQGTRYVYAFMKWLMTRQKTNIGNYTSLEAAQRAHNRYLIRLNQWKTAVANGDTTVKKPKTVLKPHVQTTTIRLHNNNHDHLDNVDFYISWSYIVEETFSGKGRAWAKKGDCWVSKGPKTQSKNALAGYLGGVFEEVTRQQDTCTMYVWHQVDKNTYTRLKIVGMQHRNLVYNGESVIINTDQALDNVDESPFFAPLHYEVLEELPLIVANQVCTESVLLNFNCYKVVETKWYQKGWFKIVLAIVVIGISIVSAGAGLATMGGVLGTNAAVGAALGLSGMTAAIAGAVANAVAAMIITQIITLGVSKIAPGRLGAILGAVISAVVVGGLSGGMFNGQGFQWEGLMRADNLLRLTESAVNAFSKAVAAETQTLYGQIEEDRQDYEERYEGLQRLTQDLLGTHNNSFDPLMLTEAVVGPFEKPDDYIARTTMTGMDIAQLTQDLIGDFCRETLNLDPQGV